MQNETPQQETPQENLTPSRGDAGAPEGVPQEIPVKLSGFGSLIKKTWELFKKRILTLVLLILVGFILAAIGFGIFFGLGLLVSGGISGGGVITFISVLLAVTAAAIVISLLYLAFLIAIVDTNIGVKEAFLKAKKRVWPFIWLLCLLGLIIVGGMFLFIIPGILFALWFYLWPFVFITEDLRGMNAILKSRHYVKGKVIAVFWRIFLLGIISVIFGIIPLVGPIINIFAGIFITIFSYIIFEELRVMKSGVAFQPSPRARLVYIVAGLIGAILPLIIVIVSGPAVIQKFKELSLKGMPSRVAVEPVVGEPVKVTPPPELAPSTTVPVKPPESVVTQEEEIKSTNFVYGKVVDLKKRPLQGVSIKFIQNGVEKISVLTGKSGLFETDRLAYGKYEVKAEKPGYGTSSIKKEIKEGPIVSINFTLKSAGAAAPGAKTKKKK
ncbi:MAG: carboxypeptidase-like regulatory domain-containing protein [Elusimicrobiota bacterium]